MDELQRQFINYLINIDNNIQHHISNTETLTADARLNIYRTAYESRLINALSDNYPLLKKYLGHTQFKEIAIQYLLSHPPTDTSIRWFGNHLSTFLTTLSADYPYPLLTELAKFEWSYTLTFDAADSTILTLQQLDQIDDWDTAIFQLHPSVQRLNLSWNSPAIWDALSKNQSPPEPLHSNNPQHWIIWRKEFEIYFSALPESEAWAIDALHAGKSFGEICEGLCQWFSTDIVFIEAVSLLKGWILAGVIVYSN